MRFTFHKSRKARSGRSLGLGTAETLSIAAQIAMLSPSGMDVWMQRALADGSDPHPQGATRRR